MTYFKAASNDSATTTNFAQVPQPTQADGNEEKGGVREMR